MTEPNTPLSTSGNTENTSLKSSAVAKGKFRGPTAFGKLIFLSCVIGVVTGVAAWVFKWSLGEVSGFFLPKIQSGEINWWIIAAPVVGILLTGIFTRYIIRTDLTHGVGQLIQDLKHKKYKLKHNLVYSSIVGGTLTLGMGGSSGAEGPIAYTGAAIGSNIGQLLKLRGNHLKVLIACGAGAGIAAIFSAPLGGFLFATEVLRVGLTTLPVLAVVSSCLCAYVTIYTLHGFKPDLAFVPDAHFSLDMLPLAIILGLFCGIYCIYYSGVVNYMDTVYKKMRNPWIRNLAGGLMLGAILLVFPSMFGVGYPITGSMINGGFEALSKGSVLKQFIEGDTLLIIGAVGILLCKCWAVSSTNSSGGVGGDFAPTLFAGSMAGFLFATLWNHIFGTELPVALFAYFGMAGVMAGAIQAPMMAIFIVIEMCQVYTLSLPVALVGIVSYLTVIAAGWAKRDSHPLVRHHFWFTHKGGRENG